jgi:hypothetical protein
MSYVDAVLSTAVPASLLALAATNPAAMANNMISDFADGSTPSWYDSLPSNVKSCLQESALNGLGVFTGDAFSLTGLPSLPTEPVSSSSEDETFHPTTRALSTRSLTTTSATTGSISSSTATLKASPAAAEDSKASSPGLSTGAKAGIGVGVGLAALFVIAGVLLFCLRRRKRGLAESSPDSSANVLSESPREDKPTYKAPDPAQTYYQKSELPGSTVHGPGAPVIPRQELDTTKPRLSLTTSASDTIGLQSNTLSSSSSADPSSQSLLPIRSEATPVRTGVSQAERLLELRARQSTLADQRQQMENYMRLREEEEYVASQIRLLESQGVTPPTINRHPAELGS